MKNRTLAKIEFHASTGIVTVWGATPADVLRRTADMIEEIVAVPEEEKTGWERDGLWSDEILAISVEGNRTETAPNHWSALVVFNGYNPEKMSRHEYGQIHVSNFNQNGVAT